MWQKMLRSHNIRRKVSEVGVWLESAFPPLLFMATELQILLQNPTLSKQMYFPYFSKRYMCVIALSSSL